MPAPDADDGVGSATQSKIDYLAGEHAEASIIYQRVVEAISDVVPDAAKDELADKVVNIISEQIEAYSGSVPHPRHAEHWELIAPGAANRMLGLAERQADHAIEQIRTVERIRLAEIESEDKRNQRLARFKMCGLLSGFLLGLTIILGALFAAFNGHVSLSLALVGASALGTIGYFVNSHWQDDDPPVRRGHRR